MARDRLAMPLTRQNASEDQRKQVRTMATTPEWPGQPQDGPYDGATSQGAGAHIIAEDEALREQNVKHFKLSDGSLMACDYGQPVHYQGANGKWDDIDNTLVETDRGFEPRGAIIDIVLPRDLAEGDGVSISDGADPISWAYDAVPSRKAARAAGQAKAAGAAAARPGEAGAAAVGAIDFTREKSLGPAPRGDGAFTGLRKLSDKATYRNAISTADIEYLPTPTGLKENIVLKDRSADSEYGITYQIGGLQAAQLDDQGIVLLDGSGAPVWTITAPLMTDAAGQASDAVKLTLTKSTPGAICVRLSADKGWLQDSSRLWPVRIDPWVNSERLKQTITQGYIWTKGSGGKRFTDGSMYVGREASELEVCHMYTKIALPNIPASSAIVQASISLVQFANQVSPAATSMQVTAHQIKDDWNTSINPLAEPARGSVLDYQVISNSTSAKAVHWDITQAVSNWLGGAANYGICFKAAKETSYWRAQFYSCNYPNIPTDYYPYLSITYRNQIGLEAYWTAHTQGLGRSGTGYIKDMTTTLCWVHPDVSLSAGVNSLALSHVYNSNGRGTSPTSSNPGLYAGRVGTNWNLSILQRLAPNQDSGTKASYPFIYIDADGTEHYILGTAGSIPQDMRNKDEDGLGLAYSYANASSADKHRLTAKDGTVLSFDSSGNLSKVTDANGNATKVTYEALANNKAGGGDNYPVKVSSAVGAITLAWADYTEGTASLKRLESVTDPAGRTTSYSYSGDLLSKVTYPDGKATKFAYSSKQLVQVTGISGAKVVYTAAAGGTYTAAREESPAAGPGKGYTIARSGYLQTTFTDAVATSLKTTYQFNTSGNTTGAYDQDGMAAAQGFSNTPGWANNSVISSASAGKTVRNYFRDPVFSEGLANWEPSGTGTVVLSSATRYSGARSAKITNSDLSGYACIMQKNPPLTAGKTYTASAYFKASGVKGAGAGVEVCFNGKPYTISERLTGTTDASINGGFKRLSCTFTIPSGSVVDRITAGLYSSTGTVFVTGLQVEDGAVPNMLNMFTDSGFECGLGTTGNAHAGTCSKKLAGNFGACSAGYPLNLAGSPGDTYTFGGWAKAASVPGGDFGISAKITYTDNTYRWSGCDYNKNIAAWQFAMGSLDTTDPTDHTKAYKNIELFLVYDQNANNAYFDDVFLYRDNASSFTYDAQGNLATAKNAAASATAFDYKGSDIAKVAGPLGSAYEYRYDTRQNPTSMTTAEGTNTRVAYDAKGNPLSSEVLTSNQMSTSIVAGKAYYIRNMATGRYLYVKSGAAAAGTAIVQYAYNGAVAERFTVEAAGHGHYFIVPACAPTLVLDVQGASAANDTPLLTWTRTAGDNQRFKLTPSDYGAYRISTRHTSDGSVLTIAGASTAQSAPVTQAQDSGSPNQRWYLEEAKSPRSGAPKDGDTFFIQAAHSGQYLDIADASPDAGAKVIQWPFTGGANQRFRLAAAADGYFRLRPAHAPGMAVTESATSLLAIKADTGAAGQLFKFTSSAQGTYCIESKLHAGFAFDVTGESYAFGGAVGTYAYGAKAHQQFVLVRIAPERLTALAAYDTTGSYMTGLTDARGQTAKSAYTAKKGLLASATDAAGGVTKYTYDADNDRLLSATKAGTSVSYGYTPSGQLASVAQNGFAYNFEYDGFGSQTAVKVGAQALVTNTYAANNGRLKTSTYANGAKLTLGYDKYRRLTSKQWGGAVASTVTYDAFGNVYQAKDGMTGITTTYEYDLIGRVAYEETAHPAHGASAARRAADSGGSLWCLPYARD